MFLIWISFLDENNLVLLNDRLNELNKKEETIDSLLLEISEMEDRLERLNNNQDELERLARENLMKKDGEDIILIREKRMSKLFEDFNKISLNEYEKINQDLKGADYNKNLVSEIEGICNQFIQMNLNPKDSLLNFPRIDCISVY